MTQKLPYYMKYLQHCNEMTCLYAFKLKIKYHQFSYFIQYL